MRLKIRCFRNEQNQGKIMLPEQAKGRHHLQVSSISYLIDLCSAIVAEPYNNVYNKDEGMRLYNNFTTRETA